MQDKDIARIDCFLATGTGSMNSLMINHEGLHRFPLKLLVLDFAIYQERTVSIRDSVNCSFLIDQSLSPNLAST